MKKKSYQIYPKSNFNYKTNLSTLLRESFVLLVLTSAICGCGIKGPPLPPLLEETIQKQKAGASLKTSNVISTDSSKAKK